MAEGTYLKVLLTLMALYAGMMATFTLFFQEAGRFIFQYGITDPVVTRYWGGVLLALAIFYLFLSTDPIKYRLFLWVGVFDLGVAMILTIFHLSTGSVSWVQGLVGVVVNPIFLVAILYGLAHQPEGEIVLIAGEGHIHPDGQQVPEHIVGHHPLHRK